MLLFLFGYFYLIPTLFLWLVLRRAYKNGTMTREDAEGIFPLTLMPVLNFFVFIWILKEFVSEFKPYNWIMKIILGEKK